MKKVKWVLVSSLVLFLFLPARLNSEEIGILPFETVGVDRDITEAFYQLLEYELVSYDHRVVSPYEIEDYLGERVECRNKDYAADLGSSLGLEKVIFGSITRLGEKYVISAVVVRSKTGAILLSDKITSEDEEYLDLAVSCLAESIEEEVYENDDSYDTHYCRTYTHIDVGIRWPLHHIVRRIPHRSLITVRLPLININLGKSHNIPHSHPPRMEPRHEEPRGGKPGHDKPKHEKSKNEKPGHEKPKNEKPHGNDGQHDKGEKRTH